MCTVDLREHEEMLRRKIREEGREGKEKGYDVM